MRRGKKKKRGLLGIFFLQLFLLICPVYGADNSQGQDMLEQEKEKTDKLDYRSMPGREKELKDSSTLKST